MKNIGFALFVIALALFLISKKADHKGLIKDEAKLEAATHSVAPIISPSGVSPETPAPRINPSAVADPSKNRQESTAPRASEIQLRQVTPSLDRIRDEVAQNPHVTPPSLIQFSMRVGARMDSVKNETDASTLFRELEDCMNDQSNARIQTVQALCLLNARRLSHRFDVLHNLYESLQAAADPKVVALTRGL